jgi:hypothetical protein
MAPDVTPRAYVGQAHFDVAHPHALALYCSDGRFTRSVEALLRQRGHERLDTLTLPGGPALLDLWTASYNENAAIGQGTTFLVTGHGIRHAFLLAHEGCGYYRARFAGLTRSQMRERQLSDLRQARRWFQNQHPEVAVELYWAHVLDDRVAFDRVI